jgi:SAM-dependent methyltransferase
MTATTASAYDRDFYAASQRYFVEAMPAWRRLVVAPEPYGLGATSVLDVGCGTGAWLAPLLDLVPVLGCDLGVPTEARVVPPSRYVDVDLTTVTPAALRALSGPRDVVVSLEVMEHLASVHEARFLSCLLAPDPRLVVLSVAGGYGTYDPTQFRVNRLGERVPGGPDWRPQWGRHHVNCQPTALVEAKMAARGYDVDRGLTAAFVGMRSPDGRRYGLASFYRRNARVYRRRGTTTTEATR